MFYSTSTCRYHFRLMLQVMGNFTMIFFLEETRNVGETDLCLNVVEKSMHKRQRFIKLMFVFVSLFKDMLHVPTAPCVLNVIQRLNPLSFCQ